MTANELLIALSALKQGSWARFRSLVEELHLAAASNVEGDEDSGEAVDSGSLPLYQHLRLNLERLGHAEFFANGCENGWRIVPPVMVMVRRGNSWEAILCGARSQALFKNVDTAAASAGLGDMRIEAQGRAGEAPNLVYLNAQCRPQLEAIAGQLGFFAQVHAPLALLSAAPSVKEVGNHSCIEIPFGRDYKVERFSTSAGAWEPSTPSKAASDRRGLYRFELFQRRTYILCTGGTGHRVNGQAGKYAMLRHRQVLEYRRDQQQILVRAAWRPPPLIERALVLCSGRLPTFDGESRCLAYTAISETTARFAARLLGQEVRA